MAASQTTEKKSKYSVRSNLRHNGTHYASGKSVLLTEAEAKSLLDRGVVASPKNETVAE